MTARATALIADDEPLLREALRRQLALVWPELEIVAEARNGGRRCGCSTSDIPTSVSSTYTCRAAVRPRESALRRKLVVPSARVPPRCIE
jgi:hypothetical protein